MIIKMFSVYDSKAAFFSPPFFMPHVGLALRAIEDTVNDPNTVMFKHPEDFSLFLIGSFDDQTGECFPEKHVNLGNAAGLRKVSSSDFKLGSLGLRSTPEPISVQINGVSSEEVLS